MLRQRLTWLGTLGCPVTKLPTPETSVLDCGPGSTFPKPLLFLLPLLLPYLEKGHKWKKQLGVDGRREGWPVPFGISHLLSEKPAPTGPNSYKAFGFHVKSNIVPSV